VADDRILRPTVAVGFVAQTWCAPREETAFNDQHVPDGHSAPPHARQDIQGSVLQGEHLPADVAARDKVLLAMLTRRQT
jgi:hypothetical protein